MEYIHKQTQQIVSQDFYNVLSASEKKNYRPYEGEDADDGTGVVTSSFDDGDEDDDDDADDLDFDLDDDEDDGEDDDSDFDFGGGSGGGAGADGDF